jgi:hypothetical protein
MDRFYSFVIDKITKSIEEVATGKSCPTQVLPVLAEDIKGLRKKDGWFFDWKAEFKIKEHKLFKLVMKGDNIIQGLLSLQPIPDQHYIEMYLIENAPHNYGKEKKFYGVAGNLVAFACKMSFDMEFDGFVAFIAKSPV